MHFVFLYIALSPVHDKAARNQDVLQVTGIVGGNAEVVQIVSLVVVCYLEEREGGREGGRESDSPRMRYYALGMLPHPTLLTTTQADRFTAASSAMAIISNN